jgi:GntR family transcriptional regulator / MocR family aminotransferase
MFLQLDGNGPLYSQLTRALKQAILRGQLKAGSRLPATRALAAELGLSRNTVLTAYDWLGAEQLVVATAGSGTFVRRAMNTGGFVAETAEVPPQTRYAGRLRGLPPLALRAGVVPLAYDLQYGEPLADLLLVGAWRRELARAAASADWRYPSSAGLKSLRHAIRDYLARRRGVVCDADDIVIVNGAQQAVALMARLLLNEGDTAVVEDPGYQLAVHALRAHGARLVPVGVDAQGLRVDALPPDGVRLIHVTPSHQFPSGAVLSLERRLALLEYAVAGQCWLIEDDYDGEFRYDAAAIPALRSLDVRQRVVYVGSFSKVLFPGLRLGYVVCPSGLRDDLVAAKRLDDIGCGLIEQAALAELMSSGAFDRHLRRTATELRRRRAALLEGLARHCAGHLRFEDSRAGMHLVGWLPGWTAADLQTLVAHARFRGLGLHPIGPHYLSAPAPAGLLLGFASLSAKQLQAASALLGNCLREVAGRNFDDRKAADRPVPGRKTPGLSSTASATAAASPSPARGRSSRRRAT